MGYVDIHGHYAWNIDDGIQSLQEAKKALNKARKQGISTIVATPHVTCGKTSKAEIEMLRLRIAELKELANKYHIEVIAGCEFMLNDEVYQAMDQGLFIPIEDTHYLLCEYDVRKPSEAFTENFDAYIREVTLHGYTPIIAHIERYFHDGIDLEYVQYLKSLGCLMQVNTTSLLGLSSKVHQENAHILLNHQLIHFIATDTHRVKPPRSPNMQKCFYFLYKQGYTKKYLNLMMRENPRRILRDRQALDLENIKGLTHFRFLLKILHQFVPVKKSYK